MQHGCHNSSFLVTQNLQVLNKNSIHLLNQHVFSILKKREGQPSSPNHGFLRQNQWGVTGNAKKTHTASTSRETCENLFSAAWKGPRSLEKVFQHGRCFKRWCDRLCPMKVGEADGFFILLMATRNPKANHQLWMVVKPVVNHGISYPPQLVIAGFLNHQQYGLHSSGCEGIDSKRSPHLPMEHTQGIPFHLPK